MDAFQKRTFAALACALCASAAAWANPQGFLPKGDADVNRAALQRAFDKGGEIVVDVPGDYPLAGTVYVGDDTALRCAPGVRFVKTPGKDGKKFSHVILNKGALTKTWNRNIVVSGLEIVVNGMDCCDWQVFGLRGQLAFFYARDVRVERFRCRDLGRGQYCIHFCTFEDVIVDDVIIAGGKDGVHFGRGRRFTVRNGTFDTGDDPIALNAHDYSSGNPELGWIEDGVVENCHDLANPAHRAGYFCRILAGAWTDWREGMEVQLSDTVVSGGRLYRVGSLPADGKIYVSKTRPTHASGIVKLDGIPWACVQDDVVYNCGVRNVVFRDVFLHNPRTAFSVHFDNDRYSRSYYPGAPKPKQEGIVFDNVNALYVTNATFLAVNTPVDSVSFANCSFAPGGVCVNFHGNRAMDDYGRTLLTFTGCRFRAPGAQTLVAANNVPGKKIALVTAASTWDADAFSARLQLPSGAVVRLAGDLPGLVGGAALSAEIKR